jgi:hypothetical protein
LRQKQLDAWRAAQGRQPALLTLNPDFHPAAERTAEVRYAEPTLLCWMRETTSERGG